MGKVKSDYAKKDSGNHDDGPTTEFNFVNRSAAYVAAHGGEWHMIRSDREADKQPATPAPWMAWMRWFEHRSIPIAFKEHHGVCAVPSIWPEEFDPSAEPSPRYATFPVGRVIPKLVAVRREAESRPEIDPFAAQRRKDFIANWRAEQAKMQAKQSLKNATAAGVSTPLETLDARKLQGEHREMVMAALDAKIATLAAESAATPLTLSPAALATPMIGIRETVG